MRNWIYPTYVTTTSIYIYIITELKLLCDRTNEITWKWSSPSSFPSLNLIYILIFCWLSNHTLIDKLKKKTLQKSAYSQDIIL